jgi:hypothetical protein
MMNFIVVHGQRPSKLMNDDEVHELAWSFMDNDEASS